MHTSVLSISLAFDIGIYCISGTFGSDFNLVVSNFLKIPLPILFLKDTVGVFNSNPGQFVKLNVSQSVFVAKSPNLMSAKCITRSLLQYALFVVSLSCLVH